MVEIPNTFSLSQHHDIFGYGVNDLREKDHSSPQCFFKLEKEETAYKLRNCSLELTIYVSTLSSNIDYQQKKIEDFSHSQCQKLQSREFLSGPGHSKSISGFPTLPPLGSNLSVNHQGSNLPTKLRRCKPSVWWYLGITRIPEDQRKWGTVSHTRRVFTLVPVLGQKIVMRPWVRIF